MAQEELKTEHPTAKRLSKAHEEGTFARSPDLGVLASLLGALGITTFTLKPRLSELLHSVASFWSHFHELELTPELAVDGAKYVLELCLYLGGPLFLVCAASTLLVGGLQTGFRLSPKAVGIKWERLDPIAGFRRLLSTQSLVQCGLDFLKILAISGAVYYSFVSILTHPFFHNPLALGYLGGFLMSQGIRLGGACLGALGVIAVLHYGYQRYSVGQQLMMSKQEVKDELREQEGDPYLKAARRQMALKLLQRQMLQAVPTADVVVTNPTHYAVVLQYQKGKDKAPVLVAKGKDLLARRIRELAQQYEVPCVENPPVARLLYRNTRVGGTIPVELYQMVADILSYVYRTHRYYFHRLKARRLQATAVASDSPNPFA